MTLPPGAAVVVLGPSAMDLARRIKGLLPGSRIHGLARRVAGADESFDETVAHLRRLFAEGVPVVGLCAAGILIRAVAPLLSDKRREPAVVAVADDGGSVVPLLGGHRGANALARAIAAMTGGHAAVTTAGDVRLGLALDDPPPGWTVANPESAKAIAASALAGRKVGLRVEAGRADWLMPLSGGDEPRIRVTDRLVTAPGKDLIFHPPVLAVGVGCERGTSADELTALVERTLAQAGLAKASVAAIVSLDLKADEEAMHALAAALSVPVRFFDAATLEAETPRLASPSEAVFREVGCHGVAEGAALAAVGGDGTLIVPKTKSRRATCAVARALADLDPDRIGRPQGRLTVVGIGPGTPDWRTPEASRVLGEAEDVVGYGLYLDLLGEVIAGKRRHESNLSEEEARVRKALDLAAAGRRVALVSSGDAGIYALAALVFELLDRENRADWNRIALKVVPGVSAFQAAAARIGAPMGHDFCLISLSDLLTPWADIERRLAAAAAGDFVVALYNPASRRRQNQLVAARDILMAARGGETPVVLARNIGRAGERIEVIPLRDLGPDRVDMLTLVLIGSSNSRLIERGVGRWVYTPRGYERKRR